MSPSNKSSYRIVLLVGLLAGAATMAAQGQRPFGGFFSQFEPNVENPEYDGRFTFAR